MKTKKKKKSVQEISCVHGTEKIRITKRCDLGSRKPKKKIKIKQSKKLVDYFTKENQLR